MLCLLVHLFALSGYAVRMKVRQSRGAGIDSVRVTQAEKEKSQLSSPPDCFDWICIPRYPIFGGQRQEQPAKKKEKGDLPDWFAQYKLDEYCEAIVHQPTGDGSLGGGLDSVAWLVKLVGKINENSSVAEVAPADSMVLASSEDTPPGSNFSHGDGTVSVAQLPGESDASSSGHVSDGGFAKHIVMKHLRKKKNATLQALFEYKLLKYLAVPENQYIVRVVPALDSYNTGYRRAVFTEYANGNDFKAFWKHALLACRRPDIAVCWRARAFEFVFFLHALKGLEGVHQKDLVHMDLKLDNIMLNFNGEDPLTSVGFAMLIDLGFAQWQDMLGKSQGTFLYAAPEVWLDLNTGHPGHDMWSMGVVLYLLVFHTWPQWYDVFANRHLTLADEAQLPKHVLRWAKNGLEQDRHFKRETSVSKGLPDAVLSISKTLLTKLLLFSSTPPFHGADKRAGVQEAIGDVERAIQEWINFLKLQEDAQEYNLKTVKLIEVMSSKLPSEYGARLSFPPNVPQVDELYELKRPEQSSNQRRGGARART